VNLNDEEISFPLEGMIYRTVRGINVDRLNAGENRLTVKMSVRNPSRDSIWVFSPTISLCPMKADDLEFQTGPILGAFGDDYFTLTARTNLPATVSVYSLETGKLPEELEDRHRLAKTEEGLLHRVRVPRAELGESGAYAVIAVRDGFLVHRVIDPPYAPGNTFRFLVVGDTRTSIDPWRAIAAAAVGLDPILAVHLGDMVSFGLRDWEWDTEYWEPGQSLLSTVPLYPVIGNHEAEAPLYDELAFTPSEEGRARNWAQRFGGVLLIGIDGRQNWSAESANAEWLKRVLSESDAEFKLVFSHYPGWSSAGHGQVNEDGVPVEEPVRNARETVIPIMGQYGGSAFFAGHDHDYERSEIPGGVTAITCGGGGAGLYRKTEQAEFQNPYSQIFFNLHHFCILDVTSGELTLRAITPEGEVLDFRRWVTRDPE
jgi:hypothetical protein